MPAVDFAPELGLQQPYPGLRPFELDEALQFYGRESHTAELLRRLSENRFLGVVGSSGSGKSSLARAGLLPALYRGRLVGATSQWRICVMRPGSTPLANLAEVLAAQNVLSRDPQVVLEEIGRSSLGLVRAVRASNFAEGESLLLVVDQFEELFRFVRERKEEDGGAEARLFVSSLVEAADVFTAPVYVVLTMRSDFMGDCTQFAGLPEALNRSQYLIPRLTREQVRDAIEKPLRLVGTRMSPRLVERLLNELGDDTGQLPVLQHVLNRTFQQFRASGAEGEITVDHYLAAGAMDGALDAHADSLLSSLGDDAQPWAEKFFRCLTTVEGGRRVRRPTRLDRIYEIAGARDPASRERIREIIQAYSHRDHSLVFSSGTQLTEASVIDISHESLIARWARLELWTGAESKSTGWYRSAADDVVRNRSGEAGTWRDPELSLARKFIEQGFWNPAWAARLTGCAATFDEVEGFLKQGAAEQRREREAEESRRARELSDARALAEAEQKGREQAEANAAAEARAKRWLVVAAVFLLLAAVAGAAFAWTRQQEVKALKAAAEAERRADELRSQLDSKLKSNQEEINAIKAQLQDTNQSKANLDHLKLQLVDKEKEKANIEMQRVAAEGKASSQQTDLTAALSQIDALKESLKKEQDNAASARTSTDKVVSDLRAKNDDLDKKLRAFTPQLMTALGIAFEEGRSGLPKDDTQAVAWYRKAAEAGDARGMANLGRMYADSKGGLPRDDAQALAWYRKAADAGDGPAMTFLGFMYLSGGGGLPKDDVQAVAWYRKAADAGDGLGMNSLGIMFANGRGGLTKDKVQAAAWYRKAAEAGNGSGMSNLGYMYEVGGGGLPKDLDQAVAWYQKAAAAGDESARDALKRLGR
jgi:TPR repeat protein